MYKFKRYTQVELSTNVKKALDEFKPENDTYSQFIDGLVKNKRLLEAQVYTKQEVKSHETAARVAIEKASSINGIFLEILNRQLIRVAKYDYSSTYGVARPTTEGDEALEFDHSKEMNNLDRETRLYLIEGSPNRGVIEVIKEKGFNSDTWTVSYLGYIPFKIGIVGFSKEKKTKSKNKQNTIKKANLRN